jgi:cysteine desulfurase
MIYYDHASTTSVHPEVARVLGTLENSLYGNSDSLHQLGRQSSDKLEKARRLLAQTMGVKPSQLIFTSCGSESNSLAVAGFALANQNRGKHILTSNVEHSSTHHAMDFLQSMGFDVERLPVGGKGYISPEQVKAALRKDTILVSLMHINNETGFVNDISAIADVVHEHPFAVFHSDLVQSFGKIDIPFDKLDLASISAHKINGLKGSGLLFKRENVRLQPLIFGGQQEQGLRGGTANAPVHICLAKTVRLALEHQHEHYDKVKKVHDFLESELKKMPGVKIHSGTFPYILNVSFDQITSEVLMNALDAKGVCVSAKSTCESRSSNASEVLLAMGKSRKDASHAVRLSFGAENTIEEARMFLDILQEVLNVYGLPL